MQGSKQRRRLRRRRCRRHKRETGRIVLSPSETHDVISFVVQAGVRAMFAVLLKRRATVSLVLHDGISPGSPRVYLRQSFHLRVL